MTDLQSTESFTNNKAVSYIVKISADLVSAYFIAWMSNKGGLISKTIGIAGRCDCKVITVNKACGLNEIYSYEKIKDCPNKAGQSFIRELAKLCQDTLNANYSLSL